MAKEMTWHKAIQSILADSDEPLNYREISDRIVAEKMRKNIGATPSDTVGAQLSRSIKERGEDSPYIRVGKGVYTLREPKHSANSKTNKSASGGSGSVTSDTQPQYDIITSFGMFWRRNAIEWKAKPNLAGVQQLGAKPVNFSDQTGVYLLYDGREVIYVGRSTNRPLGQRLYEHTTDRLSTRWDRFSWFGLRPVADTGTLGKLPSHYAGDPLVPALEAILIEALEPRQNRKRGDDLSAVEYQQHPDEKLQKKQALQRLAADL